MIVDVFVVQGQDDMVDVAGTLLDAIDIAQSATMKVYWQEEDGPVHFALRPFVARDLLTDMTFDGLALESDYGDPPCPFCEAWYIVRREIEIPDV